MTTRESTNPSGAVPPAEVRKLIATLQRNWRAEMDGARTYRELAGKEPDQSRRDVLNRLAEAEERHAERYAGRLRELGAEPPNEFRSPMDRLRAWARRNIGTDAALHQLEQDEAKHHKEYGRQLSEIRDQRFQEMVREMQTEEKVHGKVLYSMARQAGPQNALDALLRRESWHTKGGGWLGDAIYGANDGLGAVFGIVSGVAAATAGGPAVLLAGIAGAVASAVSMGSGAYLATKSEREVYQAEIDRERDEIAEAPEEEIEEMELFYQLKGFSADEARLLTSRLASNPEQMLRTMAHEELGLNEESFPNPIISAISATISTGIGAFIPIIPFFFMSGYPAVILAGLISLIAHFLVGAAKTFVTGRNWISSGLEMTAVGVVTGLVTYLVGLFIGSPG